MKIQNPMNLTLPESCFGGGLVLPYEEYTPEIGENVFIAPNASVIGRAKLEKNVSIWFGVVVRADIQRIEIGEGSNIQDNSVLHLGDDDPCIVGRNVVVGHKAMLHGCTVEDDCLIGMGSVILNKAVIGKGSVVAAGSVVTQGTIIPPYSLVMGTPAKHVRNLHEDEQQHHQHFAPKYVKVAENYRKLFEGK